MCNLRSLVKEGKLADKVGKQSASEERRSRRAWFLPSPFRIVRYLFQDRGNWRLIYCSPLQVGGIESSNRGASLAQGHPGCNKGEQHSWRRFRSSHRLQLSRTAYSERTEYTFPLNLSALRRRLQIVRAFESSTVT